MASENVSFNRHVYINKGYKKEQAVRGSANKVLINPKFFTAEPEISSRIHVNPSRRLTAVPKTSTRIHVNPSFISSSEKSSDLALQHFNNRLPGSSTNSHHLGGSRDAPGISLKCKTSIVTNCAHDNRLMAYNKSSSDIVGFTSKCDALINETNCYKRNKFKFVKTGSKNDNVAMTQSDVKSKSSSTVNSVKYTYKRQPLQGKDQVKDIRLKSLPDTQINPPRTNKYKFRKSGTLSPSENSKYKDKNEENVALQTTVVSKYRKSNKQTGNTPQKVTRNIQHKYKMVLRTTSCVPGVSGQVLSRNKVYIKENKRKVTSAGNSRAVKARNSPGRHRLNRGIFHSTNHLLTNTVSMPVSHKIVNVSSSSVKHKLIRATNTSPKHKLVVPSKAVKHKLIFKGNIATKHRLVKASKTTKYRLVRTSNSEKRKLLGASNSLVKYKLFRASNSAKYRLLRGSNPAKYRLVKTSNPAKHRLSSSSGLPIKFRLVNGSNAATKYRFVSPGTLAQYNFIEQKPTRHSLEVRRKGDNATYLHVTSFGGTERTWNRYAARGGRTKHRYRISQNMTKLGSKKLLHTPGSYNYTSNNLPDVNDRNFSTSRSRVAASQVLQKTKWFLMMQRKKSSQLCLFYTKFGKCSSKDKSGCPYKHDPQKVAVCRRFLSGKCQDSDCLLSHEVAPEKMPTCTFFLRGVCVKENCPYLHVKVNPNAEICKDFVDGYCSKGVECRLKHELKPKEKVKLGKRKAKRVKEDIPEAADIPKDEKEVVNERAIRYYNVEQETCDLKGKAETETREPVPKKRRISGSLPSYIPLN